MGVACPEKQDNPRAVRSYTARGIELQPHSGGALEDGGSRTAQVLTRGVAAQLS